MRKPAFSDAKIEQIILMAWGDTISFETIERDWGLTPNAVMKFMRTHQSPKTYVRWRARVEGRSGERSKHELISKISSCRQKFSL